MKLNSSDWCQSHDHADSGIPGKIMNVSFESFKIAHDHTPDSFIVSFISDLQTVSSYLPLQVLLEVFPEM